MMIEPERDGRRVESTTGGVTLPPIRYARLHIARIELYSGGTREVFLEGALAAALPGQFLMADVDPASVVMRPYTIFRTPGQDTRTVLVRGTLPPGLKVGQDLPALGPLGTPFPIEEVLEGPRGQLIVAIEDGRLAPVYSALQALGAPARERTRIFISGTDEAHFDGISHLEALGLASRVEHGAGRATTRLLATLGRDDRVWAAMPESRLAALAEALEERRLKGLPGPRSVHASVETPMACGVGACYGCPVRLRHPRDERHPYVRACTEGPVLPLGEVLLA